MKKFRIFLATIVGVALMGTTFASSVDTIIPIDSENLQVVSSSDVVFPNGEVKGDIKIVKDVQIVDSVKDPNNDKKITLNLLDSLKPLSNYNILSVGIAEGSIEFETSSLLLGEYTNPNLMNEKKIIEKVNIISPTQIELFYNYSITEGLFDFKVLNELKIKDIKSTGNNVLDITLDQAMEKSSFYMLMISILNDSNDNEIKFDEMLYDFATSDTLIEKDSVLEDNNKVEDINTMSDSGVLLANTDENKGNLEQVAMSTGKQPETGPAAVWLIAISAFLLAIVLLLLGNKKSTN